MGIHEDLSTPLTPPSGKRTVFRGALKELTMSMSKRSLVRPLCILALVLSAAPVTLEATSSQNIAIYAEPPFFSPNQLAITMDTPLTWKNRTHEPHTIVSDDCRRGTKCSFDSGFLGPNARYTLPQLTPGHYPYHCSIHPFMRGFLIIRPPQSFPSSDI